VKTRGHRRTAEGPHAPGPASTRSRIALASYGQRQDSDDLRAPALTRTRSCTAPPEQAQRPTFGRETISAMRPIHRRPGPASAHSGNALPSCCRQLTQRREANEATPTVHVHRAAHLGLETSLHYGATASSTHCYEAVDTTATTHARQPLPGLKAAPHYHATTADPHKDATPLRQHRQSASDGPTTDATPLRQHRQSAGDGATPAATLLCDASSRPRAYTNALAPLRARARPSRAGSTRDPKTRHTIGARPPALTQSRHS
jgi:hypothetical protein